MTLREWFAEIWRELVPDPAAGVVVVAAAVFWLLALVGLVALLVELAG